MYYCRVLRSGAKALETSRFEIRHLRPWHRASEQVLFDERIDEIPVYHSLTTSQHHWVQHENMASFEKEAKSFFFHFTIPHKFRARASLESHFIERSILSGTPILKPEFVA